MNTYCARKKIALRVVREDLHTLTAHLDDGVDKLSRKYCLGEPPIFFMEGLSWSWKRLKEERAEKENLKVQAKSNDEKDLPAGSSGTPMPQVKEPLGEGIKFKSDGGSSEVYLVTLPKGSFTQNEDGSISFMLEEYLKHGLDNDFDQCNLAKANHRFDKKEGNTRKYEINKMHYYIDRMEK